jgi:hypothetical protein
LKLDNTSDHDYHIRTIAGQHPQSDVPFLHQRSGKAARITMMKLRIAA